MAHALAPSPRSCSCQRMLEFGDCPCCSILLTGVVLEVLEVPQGIVQVERYSFWPEQSIVGYTPEPGLPCIFTIRLSTSCSWPAVAADTVARKSS
jgi:hypothetical protein